MYYAAYLKVAKVPFLDTEEERIPGQKTRIHFLFEPPEGTVMRDLKRQFFSGRAKVSALDFAQALQMMKSLTHNDVAVEV
jgi:hypothetical protein